MMIDQMLPSSLNDCAEPDEELGLFPVPVESILPSGDATSGVEGLDSLGHRATVASQIAGITYHQLDYWARTGIVSPSVRSAIGSGSQRLYSFKDILVLKIVKRLLNAGVSLQNVRLAVDHLHRHGVKELTNVTLFSDGVSVYQCTSEESVRSMRNMGVAWIRFCSFVGLLALAGGCGPVTAPRHVASASAAPINATGLCAEVHGDWDGAKETCSLVVTNAKHAQLKLTATYPASLVDTPAAGSALSDHIRKFFTDFGRYDDFYTRDSDATLTYTTYEQAPAVRSVLFTTDSFFAGAAHPNTELATFTFDLKQDKQLQLPDLLCSGIDQNTALPTLVRPYLQAELDKINGQQPPGTAPLEASDFEPNQPGAQRHHTYVENYDTWLLDDDSLVLVMPSDREGPISAGLFQPHIPLSTLHSILRDGGCSA